MEFLNKFYQCLLYGQLLHKAKKLVVCGANNSGKSSWARIFFGLMNRSKIVSVTKEKTFGLSMVDEDIELIFIDEWSENTLDISNVKTLFQGDWMVKSVSSVKWSDPGHFFRAQGKFFLSSLCTLFYIFLTLKITN